MVQSVLCIPRTKGDTPLSSIITNNLKISINSGLRVGLGFNSPKWSDSMIFPSQSLSLMSVFLNCLPSSCFLVSAGVQDRFSIYKPLDKTLLGKHQAKRPLEFIVLWNNPIVVSSQMKSIRQTFHASGIIFIEVPRLSINIYIISTAIYRSAITHLTG